MYSLVANSPYCTFFLCRNPGFLLLWKPRLMTLTTPSTCLQPRAPAATSCCPTSPAPFVAPPWGTSWVTSYGSSTPCDAAVRRTLAVASSDRAPLSHLRKKSTRLLSQPRARHQPQLRESQELSKSLQSCSFQLSLVLGHRILVPGSHI